VCVAPVLFSSCAQAHAVARPARRDRPQRRRRHGYEPAATAFCVVVPDCGVGWQQQRCVRIQHGRTTERQRASHGYEIRQQCACLCLPSGAVGSIMLLIAHHNNSDKPVPAQSGQGCHARTEGYNLSAGTGASGSSGGDRSDSAAAAAALDGQVGPQNVEFESLLRAAYAMTAARTMVWPAAP